MALGWKKLKIGGEHGTAGRAVSYLTDPELALNVRRLPAQLLNQLRPEADPMAPGSPIISADGGGRRRGRHVERGRTRRPNGRR